MSIDAAKRHYGSLLAGAILAIVVVNVLFEINTHVKGTVPLCTSSLTLLP
jgi:hypothetical protein